MIACYHFVENGDIQFAHFMLGRKPQSMIVANKKKLILFFALAYGIAWICWLPLILSSTGVGLLPITIPMKFIVIGSFAPTISALLTQWLTERNLRIFRLDGSWKEILPGLLIGPILIAATFIVLSSLLVTKGSFRLWDWAILASYPLEIFRAAMMSAGPLGEESGWRGYALPRLQKKLGPILASLVIGFLWFAWHLPLFLIPTWSSSPVIVYALILIGLSFLMTVGFNLSGHSVITAIIMHSTFNASSSILGGFLKSAEVRESPSPEFMIAVAFIIAAFILVLITRGRLAFRNGPKAT
ncbi:MAG: CPBP family intramembrane metalloprotease [Acidobacteria bacterium]|nr:CPBP family intramembrane metalloprotease [Acidobacteriota bacterium]